MTVIRIELQLNCSMYYWSTYFCIFIYLFSLVWKLPEMSYVCTIMDADAYIRSLAVVQKENKLQIICGGHKLCIWEFDCSSPPR